MITISKNQEYNFDALRLKYIQHRRLISHIVLPITRWARTHYVERYLLPGEKLLDIGCGDGYFIKRNRDKFSEMVGMDYLLGDHVEKRLNFSDDSFDCVVMLAVIEHLDYPWEILKEIRRILRPGGRLIFTTPKHAAEWIINLYVKEIHDAHKHYFDKKTVLAHAEGLHLVAYRTFIFGLNQVFCLEKA